MTTIIAFEGIDGCGKTLQLEYLYEHLLRKNFRVTVRSYPCYNGFAGREIGRLLRDGADNLDPKALALWFALDRWMDYQAHESEFRRQDFVLLNRYTLSNVVYQGARVEENADRYALIEWINKLEHQIFGLPHPDLYLVFDVPAQLAFENNRRKGVREYTDSLDVYEADASLQEQVRQLYRSFANDKVKVIRCYDGNAMLSPDAIFEQVLETLQQTEVLVCSEDLEVGLRYGTGQWMTLSEIDQAYLEGLYDAGLEEVASLLYELRKYSLVKIKIDI